MLMNLLFNITLIYKYILRYFVFYYKNLNVCIIDRKEHNFLLNKIFNDNFSSIL